MITIMLVLIDAFFPGSSYYPGLLYIGTFIIDLHILETTEVWVRNRVNKTSDLKDIEREE